DVSTANPAADTGDISTATPTADTEDVGIANPATDPRDIETATSATNPALDRAGMPAARSVNRSSAHLGSTHLLGAVTLALVAGACVANGFFLDALPLERQLVFAAVAVLAYLHGRRVPLTRGWPVLLVVALPALGYCLVDFSVGFGALLCLLVFFVLPWLAGRFRRQQAALIVAGRERVAQLEQEQALIAERVTLRERARIAAEMHDSLGHELALIALQAGALELSTDLPSTYQDAARRLRESAVTATDRLRDTVAVLRDNGTAPDRPRDESVTTLVDRATAAGMTVHLEHPQPWKPLPPLVDRAIYRTVQESLTNAARHAPGTPVTVALAQTPSGTSVIVTNPPPRPGDADPGTAGFHNASTVVSTTELAWGSAPAGPAGASPDELSDNADQGRLRSVRDTEPTRGELFRPAPITPAPPSAWRSNPTPGASGSADGSGLAGLREQARLVGGSFSAGFEEGGFVVRARFPAEEVRR
ncbi:sensor histidine kinase, partial [Nocardia sp. NPDC058176]|uniref:sensor histidine kinase n=1 Tax=Nocardia sp. NPDC058176 TaxID=3346368 RepID=UPI0036D9CB2E